MAKIRVSDHALVRYLERVHGIDLEDVRREIEDTVKDKVVSSISNQNIVVNGHRYCIRDSTITTIGFSDYGVSGMRKHFR